MEDRTEKLCYERTMPIISTKGRSTSNLMCIHTLPYASQTRAWVYLGRQASSELVEPLRCVPVEHNHRTSCLNYHSLHSFEQKHLFANTLRRLRRIKKQTNKYNSLLILYILFHGKRVAWIFILTFQAVADPTHITLLTRQLPIKPGSFFIQQSRWKNVMVVTVVSGGVGSVCVCVCVCVCVRARWRGCLIIVDTSR